MLDQDDVANSEARWHAQHALQQQEIAQAAKREKENRKQLLAKYQLQAVTSGPSVVADSKKQSSSKPVSEVTMQHLSNLIKTLHELGNLVSVQLEVAHAADTNTHY